MKHKIKEFIVLATGIAILSIMIQLLILVRAPVS
jgi:hypothetical protein